jgi:hypothetical protein
MLNFISESTKFYIAAPANYATGGPELLHQLAYKMKANGKNVAMFYYPVNHPSPVHENYQEYEINFVREIEDNEDNVFIVPETQTQLLENYIKTKKGVWWLSVDNYYLSMPGIKGKVNRFLLKKLGSQNYLFFNKKLKKVDFHLAQSEYAYELLRLIGITNTYFLTDYLHQSFLNVNTDLSKKQNIVAYNPKKGIKFTKKLIQYAPDIVFVPIENMTREQVVQLLQIAKVYIDFGFHPGKDRIPREAACLRCCVITNLKGAAAYFKDIPIPSDFKFDETINNLSKISAKIHDCFTLYDQNLSKFDDYRFHIANQEKYFESEVLDVFGE